MDDREQRIKELLRNGEHRQAAELLIAAGEKSRAMEAFAAVWDYGRAAEIALSVGDHPAAIDYLLRGGDRAGAADVLVSLSQATQAEADRALELLLARGEKDFGARLLEARGELLRAAELVRSLGELRRAAALLERAGQLRDAGRLYERLLREDPEDATAALALGTILRRFGKLELAARMLQTAAKRPRSRRAALRGLVAALHGLGLRDAAASALEELLEVDGSAPQSVEALVAVETEADRSSKADQEGQWIGGRYQVLRVLGGGAAGRVYLARDALYEREVALKVLAAGAGDSAGRDAFTRFAREAQIAAKLDHPNIVRVLDFESSTGVLVMEHLGGGTLADRIGAGPVPLALIREVLLGVLSALETAHLRGVVHRDVKPQNILFTRGGGVKLVDFGVAHLQDLGLTQTGAFIGTLTYMAPEQITGDKVSAGTDFYALGATIFHALCGRPPFVGADLIRQHLAEQPPRPSEVRQALGERFDELMTRLLAKVAAERFSSAAEIRTLVESLDFSEPEEEPREAPAPPEPIEVGPREVYTAIEAERAINGGVARRARFKALDRPVELLRFEDQDRFAQLTTAGRALSPFLQTVLDAEPERFELVLEVPEGKRLTDRLAAEGPLLPLAALQLGDQLCAALGALHGVGQVHGQVSPELVWLGDHCATLELPWERSTTATVAEDVSALIALVVTASGAEGDLRQLLREGPVAEALGARRAARLLSELIEAPDLQMLRSLLSGSQRALRERLRAQEHLHALAASARAAGAAPKEGPLADYLEARAAELDA